MKRARGFTLIELIMVIVIIGILASIAIPRFLDLRQEARQAACKGSGSALRAALSSYYASAVLNVAEGADACTGLACWPAEGNFSAALKPYLQGTWPAGDVSSPGTTWSTHYTNTTTTQGYLDVDGACPAT